MAQVRMQMSLDHSLHFHRDVRVDQWLLFHVETSVSSNARGEASLPASQPRSHTTSPHR